MFIPPDLPATCALQATGRAAALLPTAIDHARAPVVFAWLLYRQDIFTGATHLEILYRLERVGCLPPDASTGQLQPSPYYGQSVEMLRALLRVQQHRRLPPAAAGQWQGPFLVCEWPLPDATVRNDVATAEQEIPADPAARLAFARVLARRVLHGRT